MAAKVQVSIAAGTFSAPVWRSALKAARLLALKTKNKVSDDYMARGGKTFTHTDLSEVSRSFGGDDSVNVPCRKGQDMFPEGVGGVGRSSRSLATVEGPMSFVEAFSV